MFQESQVHTTDAMTDKAAGKKHKMAAVKKGKSLGAAVKAGSPLKTAQGPCTYEPVDTKDLYLIEQGDKDNKTLHVLTAANLKKFPAMACVEIQTIGGNALDIGDWHSTPKAQIRLSS